MTKIRPLLQLTTYIGPLVSKARHAGAEADLSFLICILAPLVLEQKLGKAVILVGVGLFPASLWDLKSHRSICVTDRP